MPAAAIDLDGGVGAMRYPNVVERIADVSAADGAIAAAELRARRDPEAQLPHRWSAPSSLPARGAVLGDRGSGARGPALWASGC
ncbi:hypothetical protein [Nocardia sp. NBC_00416]|uniref:hypothetical protein n=1 Tax=Nocardia sp. NBC_00416 TaxID=2975991 RepID=UPI002E20694C